MTREDFDQQIGNKSDERGFDHQVTRGGQWVILPSSLGDPLILIPVVIVVVALLIIIIIIMTIIIFIIIIKIDAMTCFNSQGF